MIRGNVRKVTDMKSKMCSLDFNAQIHNRFDIEVIDAQTGEIKQKACAENVICSQLWSQLFGQQSYFSYIHYGSGEGTPSSADTSLFTFRGYGTPSTATDVYSVDFTNGIYSFRRKITLSENTAVGITLTEVGIGWSTGSTSLCTHAMLKDMNGNQISISKTSTDIVNIYATVFLHFPTSGFDNGSIKINTINSKFYKSMYSLPKWILGMSGYTSQTLRLRYGQNIVNSVSAGGFDVTVTPSYNLGSKTLTLTAARVAANIGNGGGIFSISINDNEVTAYTGAGGSWFNASSVTGEAIGTGNGSTKDFSTAFRFVSDVALFIDGVETYGFTVDANKPSVINDVGRYFNVVSYNNLGTTKPDLNGQGTSDTAGSSIIYENTMRDIGIKSFYTSRSTSQMMVELSDDLSTWTTVAQNGLTTLDSALRKKRYWRITQLVADSAYLQSLTLDTTSTANIHFSTPPTSGAVITANYTTACIAKDANHVFDLSLSIQLGEKTT